MSPVMIFGLPLRRAKPTINAFWIRHMWQNGPQAGLHICTNGPEMGALLAGRAQWAH